MEGLAAGRVKSDGRLNTTTERTTILSTSSLVKGSSGGSREVAFDNADVIIRRRIVGVFTHTSDDGMIIFEKTGKRRDHEPDLPQFLVDNVKQHRLRIGRDEFVTRVKNMTSWMILHREICRVGGAWVVADEVLSEMAQNTQAFKDAKRVKKAKKTTPRPSGQSSKPSTPRQAFVQDPRRASRRLSQFATK